MGSYAGIRLLLRNYGKCFPGKVTSRNVSVPHHLQGKRSTLEKFEVRSLLFSKNRLPFEREERNSIVFLPHTYGWDTYFVV